MLQAIIDWCLDQFGIDASSRLAQSLNFFIFDSIKIILLLLVLITIIGFLRTYIPRHKIKKWLSGGKAGVGNFFAALFGAATPFCSCSSIPIFIGFLEAGIPLGIAFSFLITSPMINEYLAVLMLGFFGWKITLAYILFGIFIGIAAGMILGKMKLEKYLAKDLTAKKASLGKEIKYDDIESRVRFGFGESISIIKKLWIWILIGVGIGAIIHNYIPEAAIQSIISKGGYFTVPIAVLLGVPMYGSCAAIVPIAIVLFQKGVPIGTALAFMMAVSALSLPEAVILRRAMKLKLILIFFGVVAAGIMLIGYLFNFLQGFLV